MQPRASLRRVRTGLHLGKTGVVTKAALSLAAAGSLFFAGNLYGDTGKNPNPSFFAGTGAVMTPIGEWNTGTGGLTTYDTILVASPYDSDAGTYGLRTGTGIVWRLQLEIVANPNGVPLDCTKVAAVHTATGGTVLFANASTTGSVATYTTPFTLGPTEQIKCGTTNASVAGLRARLSGIMSDTDLAD